MKAFVALCMLLFITGCGSSKPSASDGKKGVEGMWSHCGKAVRVVDFEKVNGIEQSDKQYQMDFKYNLEIITDIKDWEDEAFNYCDKQTNETYELMQQLFLSVLGHGKEFPKGTKLPFKGKAEFIKTDNGWQMQ
ncbi:MAG: hypothetical protein A3F73_00885 [Gallionellales bacterium RIFCSPLOWO2_12_FULL_59_22]|nr:MAG: hypothetical protein A3H99_11965 [Gallionellales bacterium RIFCSPLOWO2_02_FULL_59_110]OGT02576.1 MAG: hypothetical protein A2Z65_10705 [Gallionellales bacterium RIFCSPLOWO2_02_58_13]OGT11228.1 MAG: hypothetical protein A3F73_00885 [Gallionellales bacterium RIFCSPLOWO2_12_FULL_59_22]